MFTMLCINGTPHPSPFTLFPPLWLYDFLFFFFFLNTRKQCLLRAGWGLGPSTSWGACLSLSHGVPSLSHVLGV